MAGFEVQSPGIARASLAKPWEREPVRMNDDAASIDRSLSQEIEGVRKRLVSRMFATWAAATWAFQAYIMWVFADSLSTPLHRITGTLLVMIAALSVAVVGLLLRRWSVKYFQSDASVAQSLEGRFPDLDARLYAFTQARASSETAGFLEEQLAREVLKHASRQGWKRVVPGWTLLAARASAALAIGLIAVTSAAILRAPFGTLAVANKPAPQAKISVPTSSELWQVIPGDVEIQKGNSLLVTVKLPTPSSDPLQLVVTDANGVVSRMPLTQSLADPIYSAQLPGLQEDMDYRIESPQTSTNSFHVTVFELPQLEELQIQLVYPEFTGLPPKDFVDPRRLQAVEGTQLRMIARFNQPLSHAIWTSPLGEYAMTPIPGVEDRYELLVTVRETERLQLGFESQSGRLPTSPPTLKVTALPNHPAEVRWLSPGYDPQISVIEEVDVAGTAKDDFGVVNVGVTFQLAGQPPIERQLHSREEATAIRLDSAGKQLQAEIREQIAMEGFEVQPGDLMQMYLWAEDLIEGNEIRRTLGDLLVAEVRDFEQIFRQSDEANSPNQNQQQSEQSQGEPGEQQQARDLIERQKQILLATWNLLRRDSDSENWQSDVELILEEQLAVIEEAKPRLEEISDENLPPERRLKLEQAMLSATEQLFEASQDQTSAPLQEATFAQQILLQELTRLVGNEFDVQQQQGQQGQQSSPSSNRQAGSPRQQQLQQLQLDNDRNRYEQESQAQQLVSPEQQQERDRLNRLTDLAQRQEDLNEQIRQLQAALEAAEDEDEQEELRRRLERLREEQEQLLRDTEELEEDLTNDPNANREDRQQLEQARQSAQQTAQSLAEENVQQALAEGRRAEQVLDQLKDEFQQRTGDAFREGLRQLNQQLEELTQSQQDVNERLANVFEDDAADLRQRDRTTPLLDEMQERENQLDQALEDLREIVEASEDSEPVLSDELYKAFREAKQQQVEAMADESRRWIENSLPERAVPLEEALTERLSQLQQAVERSSQFAGIDDLSRLRVAESTIRELAAEADMGRNRENPTPREGETSPTELNPTEQNPTEQNPTEQNPMGQNPMGQNPMGQSPMGGTTGGHNPDPPPSAGGGAPSSAERLLDQWSEMSGTGGNPLTTDGYREWMDRLREVENLVPSGPLGEETTRIRQRAEEMRRDLQRHSKVPDPNDIDELIVRPLSDLARRMAAERIRLEGVDESVRLDKDPVPAEFAEEVREYFQRLGAGKE